MPWKRHSPIRKVRAPGKLGNQKEDLQRSLGSSRNDEKQDQTMWGGERVGLPGLMRVLVWATRDRLSVCPDLCSHAERWF